MARYEGMDELLQRLRERLAVAEPKSKHANAASASTTVDRGDRHYADILEGLLLLMREAEQLRARMAPELLDALTEEQRGDLLTILGKLLRELWVCRAALERE